MHPNVRIIYINIKILIHHLNNESTFFDNIRMLSCS